MGPSIKHVTLGGVGGCRGQRYEALHGGGCVSGRPLRNAHFKFDLSCFQPFDLKIY